MSLFHLFVHTVSVTRSTDTLDGKTIKPIWSTTQAAMRCRVEPLTSREKETIFGRVSQARYRMTWGTEDVREGDRVSWTGKTFVVRELTDDTGRLRLRYRTAILQEADLG